MNCWGPAVCRPLPLFVALALGAQQAAGQNFVYVEPGISSCLTAPASTATPQTVPRAAPVSGSIRLTCGFDQGSYTVTLNSSDPNATFAPKTFLVNFGRIVGKGTFTVTFSTLGIQRLSTTITSNMGSPAVRGYFASSDNEFNVVPP